MPLYRFESGHLGVYEAVDRDCPRSDPRRNLKPDGSWLPRVGEKYPGAISFWTEFGLEKYLLSGLQEWHRSVLAAPLTLLVVPAADQMLYQDEFQMICRPDQVSPSPVSWESFCRSHEKYPIVQKALAHVVRGQGPAAEILVFEHEPRFSEAGLQVPAGTLDPGETPETAALREAEEESGLRDLRIVRKADHYVLFRHTARQFHERHVFLMETSDPRDSWVHRVTGQGEDEGMDFHYYWMPLREAEHRLAGSQGCSIRKL